MNRELQRQNAVLMVCRLVLLTALLCSGLVIGRLLKQPILASRQFYMLTMAGYALTILYALLHPVWSRHRASAVAQVAGDLLLVTGIVYVTGGIDSPFSLLYFLPVIAAGIMLGRAGALSSATGAWVLYALLVVLIVYGWIPDLPAALRAAASIGPETESQATAEALALNKRVAYALFSHFVGFFTVGYLASYLSQKLKDAGDELQETSEVLARTQALNKNIVDSITGGIITTGMDGRITFMNHGAEEITGRRLAEVEGAGIDAFLARDEDFLARVRAELEHERRLRFEESILRADGLTLFLGFSSAVLKDQNGEPAGFLFSFQDLTEIKALEEEVKLKDRMAALGEMAAGIAHEIRNPLASMSGSVQILKKSLRPGEEEGELLDIVLRESRRLDQIVRDFLMFARPARLNPRPTDLVGVLGEALTLLRNSEELDGKHVIRTRFESPEMPAMVDADRMKQVFWNLARNALKAMPEGGALTVTVSREGPASVVVSFADEGIGMTDAQIRRAFEPFRTQFSEGTGLGLAVVFRIVQEHGGRIRVRSRVGHGTDVMVTLPAAREAAARAAAGVAGGREAAS